MRGPSPGPLTSRTPHPGLPGPQPLPGSLNSTLAWLEGASLSSYVLSCPWGIISATPCIGGWVPGNVCTQRSSGGSRLGTMNTASPRPAPSTAIQGDSENQVLVLVERRR